MTYILYPTRGGDRTYRNQERAQALALERGESLLLLYVANVHFLKHISGPVQVDLITKDLEEMGEFLLALAQEHAEETGLTVESVVRQGDFLQGLRDVIRQNDVTAVVFGRPVHDTAITTVEYISNLAQSLATDEGVETFVVHEGEIVEHYHPSLLEPDENAD